MKNRTPLAPDVPTPREAGFPELTFNGVYLLDPASGKVTLLSDKLKYPNGIDFSPDEKTLYVADYMGAAIFAYDVAADGRFLVNTLTDSATMRSPMTVVLNWQEELKRPVPTK